jgi:hypothetical protein
MASLSQFSKPWALLALVLLASSPAQATPLALAKAPRQAPPTCQQASQQATAWTVTNLTYSASVVYTTPAHQVDGAQVAFNLTNAALDYPQVCRGESPVAGVPFADATVYTCTPGNATALDGIGVEGTHHGYSRATFVWDWPTKTLFVNETWNCNDGFVYVPAVFSASFMPTSPCRRESMSFRARD